MKNKAKYNITKLSYENFFPLIISKRWHIFFCTSQNELLSTTTITTNGHNTPPEHNLEETLLSVIPAESLHNKDFYVCAI